MEKQHGDSIIHFLGLKGSECLSEICECFQISFSLSNFILALKKKGEKKKKNEQCTGSNSYERHFYKATI